MKAFERGRDFVWGKVRDMGVGDGQGTSGGLRCDPVVVEDDLVRED